MFPANGINCLAHCCGEQARYGMLYLNFHGLVAVFTERGTLYGTFKEVSAHITSCAVSYVNLVSGHPVAYEEVANIHMTVVLSARLPAIIL